MSIKCMIIEDEPLARDVLISYINDLDFLSLEFICSDAMEAINLLDKNTVDLIFLDINMPKLSGLSFYRSLNKKPHVIFTTAYAEHAVEGFELEAMDYLLKPFSFERFLKAANKAKNLISSTSENNFILLKADKKTHRVNFEDLLFFESIGDYVKAHIRGKNVLIIGDTLKKLEESLPENLFIRIHKSYIISISHLEYIEGNRVKIGDELIPVGQTYREKVNDLFNKK
ncbi:MAG: LytTR family DNA-binding domain-containing protein [Cyclobacteriaceae bacterium]